MDDETRCAVFARLRGAVEGKEEIPARTTTLGTDRYTDLSQLELEQATLFRKAPVVVAHSSELEEVGAYRRARLGSVPLLVVRGPDGISVFVNACRHRGAELVDDDAGCRKAFTCRYHAWSYRLDGSLFHVPAEHCFDQLQMAERGLREVNSSVRHGFVWACLDSELDIAAYLGPEIEADFEAYDLAGYAVGETLVHETAANWKLVMDAFSEGYHLKSLHRQSLARFFEDCAILDDFAPHVRQVGARRDLSATLEHFDLDAQTTVFYNLFPNSVLVFHPTWLTHLELVPLATDRVRVIHRQLISADAPRDEQSIAKRARSFAHIDTMVFQAEDLSISESIQRTLSSGMQPEMTLGAREEGMRLFHEARDAWLSKG